MFIGAGGERDGFVHCFFDAEASSGDYYWYRIRVGGSGMESVTRSAVHIKRRAPGSAMDGWVYLAGSTDSPPDFLTGLDLWSKQDSI